MPKGLIVRSLGGFDTNTLITRGLTPGEAAAILYFYTVVLAASKYFPTTLAADEYLKITAIGADEYLKSIVDVSEET